jgi:hypothetical protein
MCEDQRDINRPGNAANGTIKGGAILMATSTRKRMTSGPALT